jgi:hypothetical protein
VPQGEEHLHVVVQGMVVAAGDELGEEHPVAGWKLRVGAVGEVLGRHLLHVGQSRAQRDDLVGLIDVGLRRIGGRWSGAERRTGGESEGGDQSPLRRRVHLGLELSLGIGHGKRLPPVGIDDRGRRVDRDVPGVVGVRAGVEIPDLIGPVVVPEGQGGRRGAISDSGRSRGVG